MPYDPQRHHRRSVRLKHFDYAGPGWYFVTICTWNRMTVPGAVDRGEVTLTEIGQVVREEWLRTPDLRPNVALDAFVIMPNHLHGIVAITRRFDEPDGEIAFESTHDELAPFSAPVQSLGAVIHGFKAATTRRARSVLEPPDRPLWQRNYFEKVLRERNHLDQLREYMVANPYRWTDDEAYLYTPTTRDMHRRFPIR
jgi:REP element-mobilizing transposase RayT